MDEGKSIALVILGIVAIMAIIGLVLTFGGGATGKVAYNSQDEGSGVYGNYAARVAAAGDVSASEEKGAVYTNIKYKDKD